MRMAPRGRLPWDGQGTLRPAAALVLLYRASGTADDREPHVWHVPLTIRGASLRHHTGQVSLPGGRLDPGETIEAAALREAEEEVGLAVGDVELLGRLSPLAIPVSGHLLHPVVGVIDARPTFRLCEGEVERLLEVPLMQLHHAAAVRWEERLRERGPRLPMQVPYFDVDGFHVWGATAMVLAELLVLLDELGVEGAAAALPDRADE
jgi:8-oxo-dGTP pyrophosphatase MutT (NUDIX family)